MAATIRVVEDEPAIQELVACNLELAVHHAPLTVIGGFLDTIADMDAPNPELIRCSVPMMNEQAKRMQILVEDLLTLSRLESAGNPAREDPVNVPDIARHS